MNVDKFGRHPITGVSSEKMNVDKFGRHPIAIESNSSITPNTTLSVDSEGNIDLQQKRISNVGDPLEPGDCVNKRYVNETLLPLFQRLDFVEKKILDYAEKLYGPPKRIIKHD
jgi:hypothetical protein